MATCKRCSKPAYAAESIDADGTYHKSCFKCAECGVRLTAATFATVGGDLFCKRHAVELTLRKPSVTADSLEIATYTQRSRGEGAESGVKVSSVIEVVRATPASATARAVAGAANAVAMLARSPCQRCGKSAFPIESVDVNGKKWHKSCFKCQKCGLSLSLSTFVYANGEVFCRRDALKEGMKADTPLARANVEIGIEIIPRSPRQDISEDARDSEEPSENPEESIAEASESADGVVESTEPTTDVSTEPTTADEPTEPTTADEPTTDDEPKEPQTDDVKDEAIIEQATTMVTVDAEQPVQSGKVDAPPPVEEITKVVKTLNVETGAQKTQQRKVDGGAGGGKKKGKGGRKGGRT